MTAFLQGRSSRIRGRLLDLSYTFRREGTPKFACVVSKKVVPLATGRNKVRRQVREALAPLLHGCTAPIVLVFRARETVRGAAAGELAGESCELAQAALSSYNKPI